VGEAEAEVMYVPEFVLGEYETRLPVMLTWCPAHAAGIQSSLFHVLEHPAAAAVPGAAESAGLLTCALCASSSSLLLRQPHALALLAAQQQSSLAFDCDAQSQGQG
jgi:hypothetical protein